MPILRGETRGLRESGRALYSFLMSQADADLYYAMLVAHHRQCPVCTSKKDCPTGAQLLRNWGQAENTETGGWWLPRAERAALRGEPYDAESLPDPGERSQ